MKRSSDRLAKSLRDALKASGWTARRIAAELQIGEATAKRWLAGKALTLDRLETLAVLAGLSIRDLAEAAEIADHRVAQELTLAQERALSADGLLSFLFMTLLGGHAANEIATDFNLPEARIEAALDRLERLALIDRRPGGIVRPLVDRAVIWRKSPMRTQFERRMKPQFMAMDFAAEDSVYASEVIKLSDQGAAALAELIDQHRRDVQALAERDRRTAHLPAKWFAMLCALRPLDTTGL